MNRDFEFPRLPALASQPTDLDQRSFDGVLLNGVVIDLLSAGCFRPDDPEPIPTATCRSAAMPARRG
ncbi:MAG: hypothetical protein R2715_23920 [Ilumatobacteraceae bacterium]